MRNYSRGWTQFCTEQYEEHKCTALKTIRIQVTRFILPENPFCEIPILWAEFEWEQIEIVWWPSNPNGLLPNALDHIIDPISSYLALSFTDFALLLGSTTKSFKFMSLLSGGSGIPLVSVAMLFTKILFCNKKQQ